MLGSLALWKLWYPVFHKKSDDWGWIWPVSLPGLEIGSVTFQLCDHLWINLFLSPFPHLESKSVSGAFLTRYVSTKWGSVRELCTWTPVLSKPIIWDGPKWFSPSLLWLPIDNSSNILCFLTQGKTSIKDNRKVLLTLLEEAFVLENKKTF